MYIVGVDYNANGWNEPRTLGRPVGLHPDKGARSRPKTRRKETRRKETRRKETRRKEPAARMQHQPDPSP